MLYRANDKIIIRIPGAVLQFGDIAVIKEINYARLIDTYFCYCELRQAGEWMAPQHFDKYQERPVKAPVFDRIRNAAKDIDAEKKQVERPPAVYTNIPSNYKYDAE